MAYEITVVRKHQNGKLFRFVYACLGAWRRYGWQMLGVEEIECVDKGGGGGWCWCSGAKSREVWFLEKAGDMAASVFEAVDDGSPVASFLSFPSSTNFFFLFFFFCLVQSFTMVACLESAVLGRHRVGCGRVDVHVKVARNT